MQKFGSISVLACALSIGTLAGAPSAHAGPYTDDLSKCVVRSTTPDDQIAFIQWMFSAMALHPAIKEMASVTNEQRAALNKKAAALFVRLMSADCRQQTIDAIKYEGGTAIQTSFQLLGQVAMRGLMGESHVAAGVKDLNSYFSHDEKWLSFLRETKGAK